MKLILLNGPPRSGKDTAATILKTYYNVTWTTYWERFSLPHKLAFAAMTKSGIDAFGNVQHYEQRKDEVIPWLGVSYRQWQIDFSEKFMKPLYGEDIFARMFLVRTELRRNAEHCLCIISDCGFQIEVDTVMKSWPKKDVRLFTMVRSGTSYANDSRQDVTGGRLITNNGSIEELKTTLIEATKHFMYNEADE